MKPSIIYVSSNREDPEFEKKTREDLLSKCGNIPIVSVTQKPIDLGKNICVGDVGASGFNFCRQVKIAVENSVGDYVISAESDCIYSPDYFNFVPPRLDKCYRNNNLCILGYKVDFFVNKFSSTYSQVVGKDYYLKMLDDIFTGMPDWDRDIKYRNFPKEVGKEFFTDDQYEYFNTEYACISFKTGRGMRLHTASGHHRVYELPYWGSAMDIINKYGLGTFKWK